MERPEQAILVVEDDAGVRDTLAVILQDEGYVVATTRNGLEAIEYLATHPAPRLILVDLMMPIMDGFSFRRAQLSNPDTAAIPTVVLSAARDGREKARALGVQGYLQKPIELDQLLRMLP